MRYAVGAHNYCPYERPIFYANENRYNLLSERVARYPNIERVRWLNSSVAIINHWLRKIFISFLYEGAYK